MTIIISQQKSRKIIQSFTRNNTQSNETKKLWFLVSVFKTEAMMTRCKF